MNMLWLGFEFLINLIESSLSLYLAYHIFNGERVNRKKVLPSAIVYSVAESVLLLVYTIFLPDFPCLLPPIVIFFLFSYFQLDASFSMALLWSLINSLLLGLIAFTSDPFLGLLLSKPIIVFDDPSTYRILSLILCKLWQLLLTECIIHILRKHRHSSTFRISWFQIVLSLCSILALVVTFSVVRSVSLTSVNIMAIFVCFCLLSINLVCLIFFTYYNKANAEKTELAAHNERLKMQMRNHQEIHQIYENLRMLRHDLNNHLHTLHGFIGLGEYQKADAYIEEMTEAVDKLTSAYCQTGNIALDALISSKAGICKASGIHLKVNALVPPRLSIPDNQLTVLLGNLLNNAVDACQKLSPDQERVIDVDIFYRNKNLFIAVKNPTDGKEKYVGHYWRTTKQDAFEHGFGLKSIDLIVSQYNGYCTREHKANVFNTQIRLPVDILSASEGH